MQALIYLASFCPFSVEDMDCENAYVLITARQFVQNPSSESLVEQTVLP